MQMTELKALLSEQFTPLWSEHAPEVAEETRGKSRNNKIKLKSVFFKLLNLLPLNPF
jgi:hypothetical protein